MTQASSQPAPAAANPGPACRWLSQDYSELAAHISQSYPPFDVIVVGSGYGGAVAAAQLADMNEARSAQGNPPMRVCVLERGNEYLPGMFPSRLAEVPAHVRFSTRDRPKPRGALHGLFDLRLGPDACALVANGLGGGSLINGAVMEKPKFGQFSSRLPPQVERDLSDGYLDAALLALGAATGAAGAPLATNTIELHPHIAKNGDLAKTAALSALAGTGLGAFRPAAITIEMQGGVNAQGVRMNQCTLCGDCMTGCNVGARKSLDTNLLVQARKGGVEIFTGVSVLRLERQAGQWRLELVPTEQALRDQHGASSHVFAHRVILAAGTFGSTEILLRSQTRGLWFSPRLGEQFSCNGDNLAAIHGQKNTVRTTAAETQPLEPASARAVGPTITGVVEVSATSETPAFLIQEFAVPAPLKRLFDELVTTGNLLLKLGEGDWTRHTRGAGELDPLAVDAGAMDRTALVGLIGHDAANGRLALPAAYIRSGQPGHGLKGDAYEGGLRIDWPGAGADAALNAAFSKFEKHAAKLGAVVPNPVWRPLPKVIEALAMQGNGPALTVHPLGGCPMADDRSSGVVDPYGMVFDCTTGKDDPWEGTLLVLDGSVLPASLGANPALTIAAMAMRAMDYWRGKWTSESLAPSATSPVALPLSLQFPRPMYRTPAQCIDPQAKPAKVQVVERLAGSVQLASRKSGRYIVELTFAFAPGTLEGLVARMGRRLRLDHSKDSARPVNCLRLFDEATWKNDRLDLADESAREKAALVTARLAGHLRLLDREPSWGWQRVLRAVWAYFGNRGWRDIWQRLRTPQALEEGLAPRAGFFETLVQGIRLATFAGEVRRFDYRMKVVDILGGSRDMVPCGSVIRAHKRFTYSRRANPWNQLLYLELVEFPDLAAPASLKLDARFLARRGVALARLTEQEDQPSALAELACFGAYGLRLMLSIHAWSFRQPDAPVLRTPQRLPGPLAGMPPPQVREIELEPGSGHEPVRVRLTRYAQPSGSKPHDHPLVLIHGYSASGTTFAHPCLKPSMAEYFWKLGRDVWIVDLRSSAGMPTAKLPWSFEDVAWSDIPFAIDHIVAQVARETQRELAAVQVDVFAHCVGAVMLSMALLTDPNHLGGNQPPERSLPLLASLPSRIRKVVLSQKGFALSYTDANVLRAYLMRYLRTLVLPDEYQFQASAPPSATDKLFDRLLATLPYPEHEFDRENPAWPCKRTPWTATRHRMDALYERTFNVNNLSDEVLDHIDDFFGPLNIDTVSQTIHFARFNAITNAQGRNYFVTEDALQRWPKGGTLSIHGGANGMVDHETLRLMERAMAVGKVPFQKHLLKPVGGASEVGHQDGLMGLEAEETFRVVDRFFREKEPPSVPQESRPPAFEVPWLGPRIHITPTVGVAMTPAGRTAHGQGVIQLLIAADPGRAQAAAVVVPVVRKGSGFEALFPAGGSFSYASLQPYSGWLALDLWPHYRSDADGYLVLVKAAFPGSREWILAVQTEALRNFESGIEPKALLKPGGPTLTYNFIKAQLNAPGATYHAAFVASDVISNLLPQIARRDDVSFALASCQYPAGVLDAICAGASVEQLDEMANAPLAKGGIEAVLMVGDQIYSDATAGLLDPTTANDRYGRSYEEWLGRPALRSLMRRLPVHMMLDDHEIEDNWEPGRSAQSASRRSEGVEAYWQWQRGVQAPADAPLWHEATVGEFSIFMADTRSERRFRHPGLVLAGSAHIISQAQMLALQQWLADQKARYDLPGKPVRPKFVASPAWLLPRRVGARGEPEHSARCDGWEGYPTSTQQLLSFIALNDIRGVVVLSGDAHLGCVAMARMRSAKTGHSVRLVCVNAPALYAPFPFANGVTADYLLRDEFGLGAAPAYDCRTRAWPMGAGDGFVRIGATLDGGIWKIQTQFSESSGARMAVTFGVK